MLSVHGVKIINSSNLAIITYVIELFPVQATILDADLSTLDLVVIKQWRSIAGHFICGWIKLNIAVCLDLCVMKKALPQN